MPLSKDKPQTINSGEYRCIDDTNEATSLVDLPHSTAIELLDLFTYSDVNNIQLHMYNC